MYSSQLLQKTVVAHSTPVKSTFEGEVVIWDPEVNIGDISLLNKIGRVETREYFLLELLKNLKGKKVRVTIQVLS